MSKKKEEKISKICMKCQTVIHPKDNFCRLTEYKRGRHFKTGFYHTKCFRERVKGMTEEAEIKKKANAFLDKALQMVGEEV